MGVSVRTSPGSRDLDGNFRFLVLLHVFPVFFGIDGCDDNADLVFLFAGAHDDEILFPGRTFQYDVAFLRSRVIKRRRHPPHTSGFGTFDLFIDERESEPDIVDEKQVAVPPEGFFQFQRFDFVHPQPGRKTVHAAAEDHPLFIGAEEDVFDAGLLFLRRQEKVFFRVPVVDQNAALQAFRRRIIFRVNRVPVHILFNRDPARAFCLAAGFQCPVAFLFAHRENGLRIFRFRRL